MNVHKNDGSPAAGMDIQHLALLVNHIFQKHDSILRGLQLTGIEKLTECPGNTTFQAPPESLRKLPTNLYTLGVNSSSKDEQPTVHTFFPDSINLSQKEKENVYWKIRLMHGAITLPNILIPIIKELHKFGYTHLTGTIESKGEAVKIRTPFSEVSTRIIMFEPTVLNVKTVFDEFGAPTDLSMIESFLPGTSSVPHVIVVCNESHVLDMGAIRLGMRGSKGELVGRLEPLAEFMDRFQGKVIHTNRLGAEEFDRITKVMPMSQLSQFCHDQTIKDVLSCLAEKKAWCNFCGEIDKVGSGLSRCGGCKAVLYCGRQCQRSDWAGHKIACSKLKGNDAKKM